MKPYRLLSLPVLAVLAACGGEPAAETPAPPEDPEVVAVYRGGQITWSEVDAMILALPPRERQKASGEGAVDWLEGLIREIVVDRTLAPDVEALATSEDDEAETMAEEIRRQAVSEVFFARNLPPAEPVTDEEVRSHYEEQRDEYFRQGRRRVLHIFKRREPGVELAPIKAEVAELRRRILAGEGFELLAKQHSDSESRHTEGVLGWVTRDQLPATLADIIFDLEQGVPSEPLPTAEGVHLFMVEQAITEHTFGFDEVEGMIRAQLEAQRGRLAASRLAEDIDLPADSFVADNEELAALLAAGDPDALVLQVADYGITVARFRDALSRTLGALQQAPTQELAYQVLESLAAREKVYRQAESEGLLEDPVVVRIIDQRLERAHLGLVRQRALQREVSSDTERLREYYDNNQRRFSTPLRLDVRRLQVPLNEDQANTDMARLEQLSARSAAATGETSLETAAEELGGEIEELGWQTLGGLARLDPRLAALVSELSLGQLSAPYRSETHLQLFEVRDRQEPEPLPFAEALEDVEIAVLADRGAELYAQWSANALEAHELAVFRDRIQGFLGTIPTPSGASPDLTAES